MSDFPTLTTTRLWLRELTTDDAPALFAIHSDPQVMRWFGADPLPDVAAAQRLIDVFSGWRVMLNPGTRWGLAARDTGELLGTCGLFKWNRNWQCCTVGYELAPSAWGQGYMREALQTVLPWGFEHMELQRVEAQIHPDNTASIKLATTLGFEQEGRLRQAAFWGGQRHDMLHFGLLRANFDTPLLPQTPEGVVRRFWALMASNDFTSVGDVLADDYVLEWPQSRERIRGRDNFAALNSQYPAHGPWRFTLNRLVAGPDEVVTDVDITDGVQRARAISVFTVRHGRIARQLEFWPEPYVAPANRSHLVEPLD